MLSGKCQRRVIAGSWAIDVALDAIAEVEKVGVEIAIGHAQQPIAIAQRQCMRLRQLARTHHAEQQAKPSGRRQQLEFHCSISLPVASWRPNIAGFCSKC
jgi:hypothetical protein